MSLLPCRTSHTVHVYWEFLLGNTKKNRYTATEPAAWGSTVGKNGGDFFPLFLSLFSCSRKHCWVIKAVCRFCDTETKMMKPIASLQSRKRSSRYSHKVVVKA